MIATELLSLFVWPLTALILGVAFVHGIRLLVEGVVDAAKKISHDATFDTTRKLELASSVLQSTLPATIRAVTAQPQRGRDELVRTCERALIAILQANGGFPGARGDDTTRQMVREIRKMFAEVDKPTPEPPAPVRRHHDLDSDILHDHFELDMDDSGDDDDAKEIFGA